jgi:hypothetical protein
MKIDEILKQVSKGAKMEFIRKLNSGKYTLAEIKEPAPNRNIKSMDSHFVTDPVTHHTEEIEHEIKTGLYECEETGEIFTLEECRALKPQYLLFMSSWYDETHPPTGFVCCNMYFTPETFLNSLLIPKV